MSRAKRPCVMTELLCYDVTDMLVSRLAVSLVLTGVPAEEFRDFKDKVYPFFESDTLFLECCFCVAFSCFAIRRIEGCLNSTL